MNSVSDIRPFNQDLGFYRLPAARIIGMEVRSGGALGNTAPALWGSAYSSGTMERLMKLPSLVSDATFGWTMEYNPADDTFVYMVCVLTPSGTEVPDGFTFRDLPATDCALGLFGEDTMATVGRAKAAGFRPNWESSPWNAELYLAAEEKNPPIECAAPWRWLVPVVR